MLTVWCDGEMVSYCLSFHDAPISPQLQLLNLKKNPEKNIIFDFDSVFNLFLVPTFCDSELGKNSRLACESQWEHFTLQTDSIFRPINRMNELQ